MLSYVIALKSFSGLQNTYKFADAACAATCIIAAFGYSWICISMTLLSPQSPFAQGALILQEAHADDQAGPHTPLPNVPVIPPEISGPAGTSVLSK